MVGAGYREVDFDELEDENPVKLAVKALPTIRVRLVAGGGDWQTFLPTDLEAWRNYMLNIVPFVNVGTQADLDF
jgi:hypothetical protein